MADDSTSAASAASPAIAVTDLHKTYGKTKAVDGVTFTVERGAAFGLLGPNGAGKTTTIHMLIGVLEPDVGSIQVSDKGDAHSPAARRQIGLAPQHIALYDELSAERNLRFFGGLYGLRGARLKERVDWALEFAGLTDRRRHAIRTYSGGMKRRINLACALVHEPSIVLLDEPTVGVDPQSRNHIFESIETLRKQGTTILYTTHYMEEAQRLCDRVAIMDHGKILACDTVDALIDAHGGMSVITAELAKVPDGAVDLPGEIDGTDLRIETDKPFDAISRLATAGAPVTSMKLQRPDLETVFLALTGRRIRD